MISHSSRDTEIAGSLAELLRKSSLSQLQPWFSSDTSQGGIAAGQRWFDRVHRELRESKAIIVLVTPNSLSSSWVQFEAGFGAGAADLELMPVTFSVPDRTKVPNPLSHWQMFSIDTRDEVLTFTKKVLDAFSIHFDGDVVGLFVNQMLSKLKLNPTSLEPDKAQNFDNDIRRYLDKKFFDLAANLRTGISNFSEYILQIDNAIGAQSIELRITLDMSFQDALDELWRANQSHIGTYEYLDTWIIENLTTGKVIIVKEVQSEIPAHILLRAEHKFAVRRLEKPYSVRKSSRRFI